MSLEADLLRMAGDGNKAASVSARAWERFVGGVRWVYAVCRGFSRSRHLDQPEN